MEKKVTNTGNSLNDICDNLERGTGATSVQCCVNALNNKLRCEQKAFLDLPVIQTSLNIDTSQTGVCDRRAISGTANVCSDEPPCNGVSTANC